MTNGEFDKDQFIAWERSSRDTIDVKKVYIDMVDCDLVAGVLLSQIVYWHLPTKAGKPKLRVHRDGHPWLSKTYAELWDETRITKKMASRAYGKLVNMGLIEKRVWKFGGAPSVHVRIRWPEFLTALSIVTDDHFPKLPKIAIESDQRAPSLTENTTENPAEIKREEAQIPEKSEFVALLQKFKIPESVIREVNGSLDFGHANAAILLTLANSHSNPPAYISKMLRNWAKYPDEAADGLKQVRAVWRCRNCETWNRRATVCSECYADRDEVGEWAIPREPA